MFNLVDRWYRQHLTRFKFEVFTAFRFLLSLSLSLCSTDSLFQSLAHKGSLSFMQSLSLSASPTTCVCCSVLYSVSLSLFFLRRQALLPFVHRFSSRVSQSVSVNATRLEHASRRLSLSLSLERVLNVCSSFSTSIVVVLFQRLYLSICLCSLLECYDK